MAGAGSPTRYTIPSGKAATPSVLLRPRPPLISGLTSSSAPRHRRTSPYSVVTKAVALSELGLKLFCPEYLASNDG